MRHCIDYLIYDCKGEQTQTILTAGWRAKDLQYATYNKVKRAEE